MSHSAKILVLGSSGQTGRGVVRELRSQAIAPRTTHRTIGSLTPREDEVYFDWMVPESHFPALRGIERMYLLCPGLLKDVDKIVLPLLKMAREAGVRRVVLLSSSAISPGDPGLGQVQTFLSENYPEWVVLRPSWFMQNFFDSRHHHAQGLFNGKLVTATREGRLPFIDAEDIARCAAQCLVAPTVENRDYVLTGPEAYSYDDVAALVSSILSKEIVHRKVNETELVRHMAMYGVPEEYGELLAGLERLISQDREAQVTDNVFRLTGSLPRSLMPFLKAHLAPSRFRLGI